MGQMIAGLKDCPGPQGVTSFSEDHLLGKPTVSRFIDDLHSSCSIGRQPCFHESGLRRSVLSSPGNKDSSSSSKYNDVSRSVELDLVVKAKPGGRPGTPGDSVVGWIEDYGNGMKPKTVIDLT